MFVRFVGLGQRLQRLDRPLAQAAHQVARRALDRVRVTGVEGDGEALEQRPKAAPIEDDQAGELQERSLLEEALKDLSLSRSIE